ncbi:hypothetical protein T439DRAFT_384469 [Meredithblackwellia eburnea MCA 4105]
MPLSQSDVLQFLPRCQGGKDVEEVLQAYIHSKYASGNSDTEVDAKVRRLAAYLRFRNQTRFLIDNQGIFQRLSFDAYRHQSGSQPSIETAPGKEAWAKARQGSFGRSIKLVTTSRPREAGGARREISDSDSTLPDYEALPTTFTSGFSVLPASFWTMLGDPWADQGAKPQDDDDEWNLPLPPPAYYQATSQSTA